MNKVQDWRCIFLLLVMAMGLQSQESPPALHAITIGRSDREGTLKLIDFSTPRYPNKFAMVDDEDFEWLSQISWHLMNKGYAQTSRPKKELMHRKIMNPPQNMVVDHIDGNHLNNQKSNLRICTHAENSANSKKPIDGITSIFKGVYFYKRKGKYIAQIRYRNNKFHLGSFDKEIDAAMAYNAASIRLNGKFAKLNDLGIL